MMIVLFLLISISKLCVANDESISGCGPKFSCFATPDCDANPGAQQLVDYMKEKVTIPCSAVVKLHAYTKHHVYIEMLSFEQNVNEIKFIPNNVEQLEYVCSRTSNTVDATLKKVQGEKIRIEKEDHSKAGEQTLRCSFFAISKDGLVLGSEGGRAMKIKTVGGTPFDLEKSGYSVGKCNPVHIKYSREDQASDKYYSKVTYNLGMFTCEQGSHFKLEYLDSGKYKPVTSATCNINVFKMDDKKFTATDDVYIRCYTDAAFACNYPLKYTTGEKELVFTMPDSKRVIRGSAKCPATNKYLVVGNNKPILNSEIKCKNHGRGVMKWTTSEGKKIAATGPEIHCTDKLTCKPISLTAVKLGFLKDSVPSCYDGGKLSIKDKGETFNDFYYEIKCDTSDGLNKFNTTAGHRPITDETVFECAYSNEAAAISAQNKQKVTNVSIVMVVGIIIAIPLTIFLINFTCYKIMVYKNNKKTREDEEREFNLFIAKNGDEKNANKDPKSRAPAKLIMDPIVDKYRSERTGDTRVCTVENELATTGGYLSTPDYQKTLDWINSRRKKFEIFRNNAWKTIVRSKALLKKKQEDREKKALAEAKKLL